MRNMPMQVLPTWALQKQPKSKKKQKNTENQGFAGIGALCPAPLSQSSSGGWTQQPMLSVRCEYEWSRESHTQLPCFHCKRRASQLEQSSFFSDNCSTARVRNAGNSGQGYPWEMNWLIVRCDTKRLHAATKLSAHRTASTVMLRGTHKWPNHLKPVVTIIAVNFVIMNGVRRQRIRRRAKQPHIPAR